MILGIFLTFFLVFLNGFFVAAEFAIVKVRASQIDIKAKSGNKAATLTQHILKHMDGYLASTQLGITLASLGLGWVGEDVVAKMVTFLMTAVGIVNSADISHKIAFPIAFVLITVLHIVFGELAPKSIAIQRPETTSLFVAFPLQIFYFIFRPLIWFLNGFANILLRIMGIKVVQGLEVHSSEELKHLVHQSKNAGTIKMTDYDIITNAFEFSEKTVREILVPRMAVVAINSQQFNDIALRKLIEEGYSRIPCFEGDMDNTLGLIYLKDILFEMYNKTTINIQKILRPVIFVPEGQKLGNLLREFQERHIHLAMVVDEFGGVAGIVTMEDLLEELIGEVQDESDQESAIVVPTDEGYRVIATATINDINRWLPHPLTKHEHYETLSGALVSHFGKIPLTNEKISFDGYEFTILKRVRTFISLVQMKEIKLDL